MPAAPAALAAAPHPEWRPRVSPWLIAAAAMLATFMEVLDTSVANVALPHIAGNLSATPEQATWVLTSYLVSNAIVLPATGWLSGLFGRKRFFQTCIGIFTLASALCGAATSLGLLVGARVLQGIGGGALQPIAQALLLESFPPERRGSAMAVFGLGVVVAPIIGPTLGGWLTDNYTWRWIFYINLPVGALALFMVQTFIEDPPYLRRPTGRIDYLGFGLLALWLATLQVVLDKGQEADWFGSTWIRSFTLVSALALVAFVARELSTPEPIVDLRILRNRTFAVATFLITLLGLVLYGTTALLPLFLQTLLGYPALQSGLATSPRGFGSILAMLIVGRLVGKLDARLLLAFGFVMLAVSGFFFGHITLEIGMHTVVIPNVINGLALGFLFVPLSSTSVATLPREQIGNATGIFNLMRNLGGSFGISLVATLLARYAQRNQSLLSGNLGSTDPQLQARLQALQHALTPQVGVFAATQQALAILYGTLTRQAMLLSYVQTFRLLAILCLACLPVVLLLGRTRPRGPVDLH